MIREDSRTRALWDLWILVLTVGSCAFVPYHLAFRRELTGASSAIIYAIDFFFLIDILLNFRTSFRVQGAVVLDPRRAVRRYMRSMFPIDLLATLPFDALILIACGTNTDAVQMALFLRLLRLLRIVRLFVILSRWSVHIRINPGYFRIGRMLVVVMVLVHWMACAWFLAPALEGFPADSWVARVGIVGADVTSQYLRSLYWAVVTMTTVGYGDITPARNVEYVFAMIVMILGASMYAYVIANVASLLSNLNAAKAAYKARTETIHLYLRSRRAPQDLDQLVRDYYDYVWERYRGLREDDLFADLPAPLRLEVLLHLTRELLENVPLFRYCSPALRNELLLALKPQVFAPDVYVVREGEASHEVFFISRGKVEITSDGGAKSHGHLGDGEYFGLLSLILRERRTASVRTCTYSDVFILSERDFDRIKQDYPEFKDVLKQVSSERTEKMATLVADGVVL